MEGKAKAEQDSLTQAEEEDTSVQAYCADSCRQRMRSQRKAWSVCIGHNQGDALFGRARDLNAKKLQEPTRIGSN